MTTRSQSEPDDAAPDDPAVYSGQTGKGPSPFVLFMIATFWLTVVGAIALFISTLWGCIILGVAAVTLIAALLTAG